MRRIFLIAIIVLSVIIFWFYFTFNFLARTDNQEFRFTISVGESAVDLVKKLHGEKVVGSQKIFLWHLRLADKDRSLQAGDYVVTAPVTQKKIIQALSSPGVGERTITIIPGWTLRDIAGYFVKQGLADNMEQVYALVGHPAVSEKIGLSDLSQYPFLLSKPASVSLEGYIRPDTYRIYENASLEEVLHRLLQERAKQIPVEWYDEAKKQNKTMHEIFTMASILQKEVRGLENKKIVADLFWRRLDKNWALQSDATVHYISGTSESVFTSDTERASENLYNTYKYPGLPPGPISTPSLESIEATLFPTKNDYWYFLTRLDNGEVVFSKSLEEHTKNVYKYLR
jgi:UPF0755 protein